MQQPSPELVRLIRDLAIALCRSGEPSPQVAAELEELASRYGVGTVRLMVLPTSVFVRIGPADDGPEAGGAPAGVPETATGAAATSVDFAPIPGQALRLDQVDRLYALLADIKASLPPPEQAIQRLSDIMSRPPHFSVPVMIAGHVISTVGLGMLRGPVAAALVGYAALGLLVGLLGLVAARWRALAMVLPVVAALIVTIVSYLFADQLAGGDAAQLLIPPLITLLPGAALTVATIELATGAMVAGASRLIYAFSVLFLLAFGILVGIEIMGAHAPQIQHVATLGWWAPWVGVLLIGVGIYMYYNAPSRSLPLLLAVLYAVWAVQLVGTKLGGGLLGAFLGAMAITPLASIAQRLKNGPFSQVTFLTSFWLLVPGATSLATLGEVLTSGTATGVASLVNTILVVIAIALGVLVGSSVVQAVPRRVRTAGSE